MSLSKTWSPARSSSPSSSVRYPGKGWTVVSTEEFKTRLETFNRWPKERSWLNAVDLAAAGFKYDLYGERVQCVSCRGQVDCQFFREINDVIKKHSRMFPECIFAKVRTDGIGNYSHYSVAELPRESHRRNTLNKFGEVQNIELKGCAQRLLTFSEFPRTCPVTANDLAMAGFIYIGPEDRVKCVFCSGIIHKWKAYDSALQEHLRLFPDCQFAQTICIEQGILSKSSDFGVKDYSVKEIRVQTFSDHLWIFKYQTPNELSSAGFYYLGEADQVQCFSCGGILRNWEPTDNPWEEHARWFPRCLYLLDNKGRSFVMNIQAKYHENQSEYNTHTNVVLPHHGQNATGSRSVALVRVQAKKKDYDNQAVRYAVSCGYSHSIINEALDKIEMSSRDKNISLTTLLDVIFEIEEKGLNPKSNSNEDDKGLESETRQLREDMLCKVCFSVERNVLLLPCKHLLCCVSCSSSLRSCPVCRTKVNGTIRTYMS